MVYFLCHIRIRNNEEVERKFDFCEFLDKDRAIRKAIGKIYSCCFPYENEGQFSDHERKILTSHLEKEESVWIWQGRGTGDKIWVLECDAIWEDDHFDEKKWTILEIGPTINDILRRK
ncbi:hypothetical protein pv_171 [Pithovirus sibericum]|uniref:Uncharacterized protein n=1 Tax=Pithovirus sibericum TaxID=1450746 RepID=W5S4Q5_9VIRU|nr:hypothetical protein pv_171 [Pithovirus sibericum]AHH01738.1 hypothetical protein pv_171 [Pithovirus sibericum]